MSPFYAYIVSQKGQTHYRFVFIFANHFVADEWWREVSRDPPLSTIQRFTPQFYSYDIYNINLQQFFSHHGNVADNFAGRMSIQVDNEWGRTLAMASIVPSVDVIDYTSGNWFHIRSRVDPRIYWFYQGNINRIVLSDHFNQRTAFRITAPKEPEETIMIRKDKITIAMPKFEIGVHADLDGNLGSGGDTEAFTFRDFAQGKFVLDEYGYLKHDPNVCAQQEVWELVCSYNPSA